VINRDVSHREGGFSNFACGGIPHSEVEEVRKLIDTKQVIAELSIFPALGGAQVDQSDVYIYSDESHCVICPGSPSPSPHRPQP